MIKIRTAAPMNPRSRISRDGVWPLRNSEGKTFAEAKRDREMSQEIELKIAEQLVEDILAGGFSITVNDGEEDTVIRSKSKETIIEALRTTDEDYIRIMDGDVHVGVVWLIWGNGVDVISDYGGPDEVMNGLMERAQNIADNYS